MAGFAVLLLVTITTAQQEYTPDPTWQAPQKDAQRTNPLKDSKSVVAGGRKLFLRSCKPCHGQMGNARLHNSADLQLPVVQDESDGTLYWKITNGNVKHGMPSFSGLPELQRWQLVMYIRTLRR
jgi:mono/diheme cytochrome c family protein